MPILSLTFQTDQDPSDILSELESEPLEESTQVVNMQKHETDYSYDIVQ